MKQNILRPLALVAASFLAVACGDDDDSGTSGGGTGTETDGTGTDSNSGTTSDGTGTSQGSASATGGTSGSTSGSGSGSSTGGVTEVTLFGEVRDWVADSPIADVEIDVYMDAGLSTNADADGIYSLGPFQPGTEQHLVLPDDMTYWGAVIPVTIGDTEAQQEQELSKISREFVQLQQDLLMDQMPADHDPTTAFMVVRVLNTTAIDEGNVTITVDPAPAADTYYAPDANGSPVLNSSEAQFNLLPVVVYYNLQPGAPGDYTVTATHPVRECTILHPEFPTLGAHITLVDVSCPPA